MENPLPRLMKAAFPAALAMLLFSGCGSGGSGSSIKGAVFDEANGMPVHGARVSFGGKSSMLYTARDFRLSNLPKGEGILRVEAPGYRPYEHPLTLKGSEVSLEVAMRGKEVPGLSGILAWAQWEPEALRIDVRLLDPEGRTIEHFPCLPFRAEARLTTIPAAEDPPRFGEVLYEGAPAVSYDPAGGLDKLKCRIPRSEVRAPAAEAGLGTLGLTLFTEQGRFEWRRADVTLEALK